MYILICEELDGSKAWEEVPTRQAGIERAHIIGCTRFMVIWTEESWDRPE